MNEELHLDDKNVDQLIAVSRAIGSPSRYDIIKIIVANEKGIDVSAIAREIGQTEANVSSHIKQMQKADLLDIKYEPGTRGVRKVVKFRFKKLVFNLW